MVVVVMLVDILGEFCTCQLVPSHMPFHRNVPCCPRGKRSEYRLLIESAVLGLRENCGIDFSVLDDNESDRATSGSGNA